MTLIAETDVPDAASVTAVDCVPAITTSTGHAQTLASRRTWLGLAVLTLPCLLVAMDASVLNVALPAISTSLHPGSTELLWIADIYGFFLAGSLLTMGALGDRIGRRRLLLIGAATFTAMSVLAAFAPTPTLLIAARACQGIAAATLMPSTLSLIRTMFTDHVQRTTAIGVWLAALSTGGALGPLVGGALIDTFWWGAPFLIAVPVMTLLLLVGHAVLPEVRPSSRPRVDVPSAVLSLGAVLLIIGGVKELVRTGAAPTTLALMLGGVIIGAAFILRQQRLPDPLVQVSLFRSAAFSTAMATNALGFCVTFGVSLFTVQYLQLALGFSPLRAGLWTIPSFTAFIAGACLTPVLVRRTASRRLAVVGLAAGASGYVMITLAATNAGFALLIAGTVIAALGLSPVFSLATETTVSAAPAESAGAAAAMSETSTELGAALGLALLGSLGTAVYRATITTALPAGLPPDIARAAAHALPDATATAVLNASHAALSHALQATAATSAAAVTIAAILTPVLLRHRIRSIDTAPH